jgi:hypothetical protein
MVSSLLSKSFESSTLLIDCLPEKKIDLREQYQIVNHQMENLK